MTCTVYVVDQDRDIRLAATSLLRNAGFECRPFASGSDFIESLAELGPGLILLGMSSPGLDGLQLMKDLKALGIGWPVIMMARDADVATAVAAMKHGAVDFLEKPFDQHTLIAALESAVPLLECICEATRRRQRASDAVAALSARELQVLKAMLAGLPNKAIAQRLKLSVRTVEMHRGNALARLGAESLACALRIALEAGLEPSGLERAA